MIRPLRDPPSLAACVPCKQRKRRCNKAWPTCSTCGKVGRDCSYEASPTSDLGRSPSRGRQFHGKYTANSSHQLVAHPASTYKPDGMSTVSWMAPNFSTIDPLVHERLRIPVIDIAVAKAAHEILGSLADIEAMSEAYFSTVHVWMPFVYKQQWLSDLPAIWTYPSADYILLTLCMHLATKSPGLDGNGTQTSLYVTTKGLVSLLESAGYLSLRFLQARLLVSFYEMGQALNLAASISIAACSRTANALGLNSETRRSPSDSKAAAIRAEEEARVRWSIIIIDRYISLCNGESYLATEDASIDDILPTDDKTWEPGFDISSEQHTLATSSNVNVGLLARQCQVAHLLGRVLRHVYKLSPDSVFDTEEALQLELTLNAYFALIFEEVDNLCHGLCAPFGMCASALLLLYESQDQHAASPIGFTGSADTLSSSVARFSHYLFGAESFTGFDKLPPFVPYAFYQAGAIQARLFIETAEERHREALESVRVVLEKHGRRWKAASTYLEALAEMAT